LQLLSNSVTGSGARVLFPYDVEKELERKAESR
jgi:hypothetical protein